MGVIRDIRTLGRLLKEARSISELEKAIIRVINGDGSDGLSGVNITEESSLALSAVWRCVAIISESVSSLPIHLYRKQGTGRDTVTDHVLSELLKYPNANLNKSDFFQLIMTHLLLWGNGYAVIERDRRYQPESLKIVRPDEMFVDTDPDGNLWYSHKTDLYPTRDVIHLRGLCTNGKTGKSPIAVHRENLELARHSQDYGSKFFQQGGRVTGVFETPGELSDQAFKRLRNGLNEQIMGVNTLKPLLLEGGTKYTPISIPPEDAQFIATRKFQKNEIATIFGVPPHMIGDLERATNNNIEQQSIEYVVYCLMPYLIKIEEELNRKLLPSTEIKSHFFKFNTNALMRGDTKTRSEYYKNMYLISAMNPNEIRALEELNPYEGGSEYFTQQNMQTVLSAIQGEQNKNQNNGPQTED